MIHFKRIEGKGSHGWHDKRSRTGYRVFEDGREIGEVHPYSRESWTQASSGVRLCFLGYARAWFVRFPDGREETCFQQRGDAVERLRKGADWNPLARPANEEGDALPQRDADREETEAWDRAAGPTPRDPLSPAREIYARELRAPNSGKGD